MTNINMKGKKTSIIKLILYGLVLLVLPFFKSCDFGGAKISLGFPMQYAEVSGIRVDLIQLGKAFNWQNVLLDLLILLLAIILFTNVMRKQNLDLLNKAILINIIIFGSIFIPLINYISSVYIIFPSAMLASFCAEYINKYFVVILPSLGTKNADYFGAIISKMWFVVSTWLWYMNFYVRKNRPELVESV
jgi:hypothetical protein